MAYQSLTEKNEFFNSKPAELEVGASLEGTVKLITEARDPKSSGVATIEKEDGTRINVWLSTVIAGAFAAGVEVGDKVRIVYNGKTKAKNGTEYNDYTVEVDR